MLDTVCASCDVFRLMCNPRQLQSVHLLKNANLNKYPTNVVAHTMMVTTIAVSSIYTIGLD